MNIESSKKEETATLETVEKSAVSQEVEKSNEEFAAETLSKIEQDADAERSSYFEVQKIDGGIEFANPEAKEEVKKELDLLPKLGELDNEIKTAENEAKSKISAASDFSKAYHHPEYRTQIAKQIMEARKSGDGKETEKVRSAFYEKTVAEKENFESQEKERSIAEIMKEKDLVVVHAMPLYTEGQGSGKGSAENNKVFKNAFQQKMNFGDGIEMIAGLSPTISTSIPSPDRHNNGLFNKTGVILGEGKILAAHAGDSGSVAHGLYKRIPKEALEGQNKLHHSAIYSVDVEKVTPASKEAVRGEMHNELTVENPEIAGLFIDMTIQTPEPNAPMEELKPRYGYDGSTYSDDGTNVEHWLSEEQIREKVTKARESEIKDHEKRLLKMREYSEKMDTPLYVFKNENGELKKYKVDFVSDPNITEDYVRNVMVPKSNEILARNNRNFSAPEFLEFKKEYEKAVRILDGQEYTLAPVTAKDIYESKRDISAEERQKMVEDIKKKGILSEAAEKEVNAKFNMAA